MGGKSKSSTSSTTTSNVHNINLQEHDGLSVLGDSSGISIRYMETDQGAVADALKTARDVAGDSLDFAAVTVGDVTDVVAEVNYALNKHAEFQTGLTKEFLKRSQEQVENTNSTLQRVSQSSLDFASNITRSDENDTLKTIAPYAAAAAVALAVLR